MTTAEIDSVCAACKRDWPIQASQEIVGGTLRWSEHFACDCGHGFEAGGVGLPTPGVRRAMLDENGVFETWVDGAKSKANAAKVLTVIGGLDQAVAASMLEQLPAKVYEGTETECAFMLAGFERVGAKARVVLPSVIPEKVPKKRGTSKKKSRRR